MAFDFYTCKKCGRLITKIEMDKRLPTGKVCSCGGLRYGAMDLPWWGWLLPRVWYFAVQRLRGVA